MQKYHSVRHCSSVEQIQQQNFKFPSGYQSNHRVKKRKEKKSIISSETVRDAGNQVIKLNRISFDTVSWRDCWKQLKRYRCKMHGSLLGYFILDATRYHQTGQMRLEIHYPSYSVSSYRQLEKTNICQIDAIHSVITSDNWTHGQFH